MKMTSKRRRTKVQIEEEKLEAELQKKEVVEKMARFDKMAEKIDELN